ncbi:MAG: hypothetical protein ACK5LO_01495 [Leucobacter sp.]
MTKKQGVRQFKVEYTLRAGKSTAKSNPVLKKKAYSSAKFADDKRSVKYQAPKQKWSGLKAGVAGGYWMRATVTWKRPGQKDWTVQNYVVAVCSGPVTF